MSDEDGDSFAREDQGPAERLIRALRPAGDPRVANRVAETPGLARGRGTGDGGIFAGLFRFTFRIWRANLLPLLVVGLLATAAGLLTALLTEGIHSSHSFSGALLVAVSSQPPHVRLSAPVIVTGLISIAAYGWATATIVAMLVGHVGDRRPVSLRDLGCGLPFWGWVTMVYLLEIVLDRGASVVEHVSPVLFGLGSLGSFIVSVLFLTGFAFYSQWIVDERRDGFSALGASWLLVFRHAGFWRVLGYQLLLMLCLAPILLADVALTLHFGTHSILGGVSLQVLSGVVAQPLSAALITVMYLLARGRREQVEAVLGTAEQHAVASSAE